MNVPNCDPQVAAGWVFALAIGLSGLLLWWQKRLDKKIKGSPNPGRLTILRVVLVACQFIFIGAAAAIVAQTRLGGSLLMAVSAGVDKFGSFTDNTGYAVASGAVALAAVVGLAVWWVKRPSVMVAALFGLALLVLAGFAPWVKSAIDFAVNYPLNWVSEAVAWLMQRGVS